MTKPIDLPVDVTVKLRTHRSVPVTRENSTVKRGTVSSASSYLTSLSPTQAAVFALVNRFGMATTSQIRRALYVGTPRGTVARSSRHLKALFERGFLKRLPYKLSGWGQGSGEYVYAPADSHARIPNLHTLDITALYTVLVENQLRVKSKMVYDPEPWCHTSWQGHKVTPDAFLELDGSKYWLEIDRNSESPSVISAKMNRYVNAFNASYVKEGEAPIVVPQIIWFAHEPDRVRTLQREADKKEPGLFKCALFSQALEVLGGNV